MRELQKKRLHQVAAFTMLELIVTLVIIGVLAAAAAPVFFEERSFAGDTARDDLLNSLLYSQQLAMADGAASWSFVATANGFSIEKNGAPIQKPDLTGPYPQLFEPSITLTNPTTFTYDTLGNTSAATLVLSGGEKVCVESSGYAYAC